MESKRPRVSRDTRLLFVIILISVATLWVLARIRFPDRPPTPNPVPPVLAQLAPPSAFDDIASTIAQVEPALQPSMVAIDVRRRGAAAWAPVASGTAAALRFRDGVAVALLDAQTEAFDGPFENGAEVARDRASNLAVVRVPGGPVPALMPWPPRQLESPRFLLAADARREGLSLRPVFVGSLYTVDSPTWARPVWVVPRGTDLAPGTFVFSLDGAFAGLTAPSGDGVAIVPAETVLAMAERVARDTGAPPGHLGISVQALTPAVAAATGAAAGGVAGVVVTWVDPQGPAAEQLRLADLVVAVGGQPIATLEAWQARAARMRAGESVALTVRRLDGVHDVPLTAAPEPAPPASPSLGLALRTVRRASLAGAEVVRVDPGSAAFRAGIQAGDVITAIGDAHAPTAARVSRAFAEAPDGALLLVGIARGDAHHVVVLERQR